MVALEKINASGSRCARTARSRRDHGEISPVHDPLARA